MAADSDITTSFIPSLHKPSSLLPIARHRQSLLFLIENYPVVIVVGQTGSGKTTQIPQYLEQAGWTEGEKVIAVTQVGKSTSTILALSQLPLILTDCSSLGEWLQLQLLPGWQRR